MSFKMSRFAQTVLLVCVCGFVQQSDYKPSDQSDLHLLSTALNTHT